MDGFKYKCVTCKSSKKEGSKVYMVIGADNYEYPCCSQECAEKFKAKSIKFIKERLWNIEGNEIIEDVW